MKGLGLGLALVAVIAAPSTASGLSACRAGDSNCQISQASNDWEVMPEVYMPTIVRIYAKALERYNAQNPKDLSQTSKEYWNRRYEEARAQGLMDVRSKVKWYSYFDGSADTRNYLESYLPLAAYYLVTIRSYQQEVEELLPSAAASAKPRMLASVKAIEADLKEIARLVRYTGPWDETNLHRINDRAYTSKSQGINAYRSDARPTSSSGYSTNGNNMSRFEALKRCNKAYPTAKYQGGDQAGHKACMKMLGY